MKEIICQECGFYSMFCTYQNAISPKARVLALQIHKTISKSDKNKTNQSALSDLKSIAFGGKLSATHTI